MWFEQCCENSDGNDSKNNDNPSKKIIKKPELPKPKILLKLDAKWKLMIDSDDRNVAMRVAKDEKLFFCCLTQSQNKNQCIVCLQ